MFSSGRKSFAFTLIEILIVVAIIVILSAIAVPNFLGAQAWARTSRAMSDMRSLATAVNCYMVDYNVTPRVSGVGNAAFSWYSYCYPIIYYDSNQSKVLCEIPLTTPVACLTNSRYLIDPFVNPRSITATRGYWMVCMQGMLGNSVYDAFWKNNDVRHGNSHPWMSEQNIFINGQNACYNFLVISMGPDETYNYSRTSGNTGRSALQNGFEWGSTLNFQSDW